MSLTVSKRAAFVARNLAISLAVIAFVCCCGLHAYSHYMLRRAFPLLSEVTSIKIGDSEESILDLVARYGGSKWYPSSSSADDGCINIDCINNNVIDKDHDLAPAKRTP